MYFTQGSTYGSLSFLSPGHPTLKIGDTGQLSHVCHADAFFLSWLFNFRLSVCYLAIVPLEKLFDYGGEQLALYCGEDLGDLIVITLNKYARV